MVKHLTAEERQEVALRLGAEMTPNYVNEGTLVSWPAWAPKQYNACTDPCDMWSGPCACGAWHREGR